MRPNPDILATIEFLPTEHGGRQTPVFGKQYRSPMLIRGEYFDCSLDIENMGTISLGERKDNVPVTFLRGDNLAGRIRVGDVFALKELGFVAIGYVTQVFI